MSKAKRAAKQEALAIREAESSRANPEGSIIEQAFPMAEMSAAIIEQGASDAPMAPQSAQDGAQAPLADLPLAQGEDASLADLLGSMALLAPKPKRSAKASQAPAEILPEIPELGPIAYASLKRSKRSAGARGASRGYSRDAWDGALPKGPAIYLGGGKASLAWLPIGAEISIAGFYQILSEKRAPICRYAIRYGSGKDAKASILGAALIGPKASAQAA